MKRSVQTTLMSPPKRSREIADALPPGASLLEGFVSLEEEACLIAEVDKGTWNTSLKRRTQHYGIEYNYKTKWIATEDKSLEVPATSLPTWCKFLIDRLHNRGIISSSPIQLLVNEYEPGQGIARHSDSPAFGNLVLSLSLGSTCIMQLRRGEDKCIDVPLDRRSLLVLTDEARWKWTHEIPARKSDIIEGEKTPRTRRVSLTFRWLKKPDPPAAAGPPTALPTEHKILLPNR